MADRVPGGTGVHRSEDRAQPEARKAAATCPAPPMVPAGSAPVRPVAELVLSGDVDMQDAQELQRHLTGGLERGCDIVVDLTEVRLIDCVCLGVLARAAGAAHALGSTISLVNPSTLVRMTLRFTATDSLFPIFDDRETALRRC